MTDNRDLARRNIKLALIHVAIAVVILAAFVWSVSHK
jgi:hypothetical protein